MVALGYRKISGVDYEDLHAPVISDVGFRLILLIVIEMNWEIKKLDVEAAFLVGKLDEVIYITIPEGFNDQTPGPEHIEDPPQNQ